MAIPPKASEKSAIADVAERLKGKNPTVNSEYIDELVQSQYERLLNAKLRDYIPVLVEHQVKQDLRREREKHSANLL